jgi:nucleotide-binding universal stress UspA family protein
LKGPVLIGLDERPASRDALELAAGLCEQAQAGLIAAFIPQSEHPFTPYDQRYQQEIREYIRALRGEIAPALERVPGDRRRDVRVYHALDATTGLHELAVAARARLTVVGSSHRTPVGRVLVGSTAAQLLVHASCPIAVAPRGLSMRGGRPLRRLGVALDGCRASEAALERARDLATDLDADLIALSVATSHGVAASPPGIEHMVLEGRPVPALSHASEDLDLLVVGCREAGGVAGHPTLRSVSRRLLETSACPLVVVPENLVDGGQSPSGSADGPSA